MTNKVKYLVTDTSAFIKNAALQDIGTNIVTIEDVVNEIKSKRQLKRLVVLPYDLVIKDVFSENVAFVTEFSKKTGDYPSLSATDIKVIALVYQLEKEYVGMAHLKNVPEMPKSVEFTDHSMLKATDIPGFYLPKGEEMDNNEFMAVEGSEEESEESETESEREAGGARKAEENGGPTWEDCLVRDLDSLKVVQRQWEGAEERVGRREMEEDAEDRAGRRRMEEDAEERAGRRRMEEDTESGISEGEDFDDEMEEKVRSSGSSCEEVDDDEGWITPDNVAQAHKDMVSADTEQKPVTVACLTTDFAMQNVLKQIGLTVVSLDGYVINQVRTYIFRCYSCFKTTSVMTKVFCPKCGNKTLKRVGVSIDKDNKQHIHINLKKPLTARGKRYSLPMPQGGKFAKNPVLCEDQRIPDQRISRLARAKNNPMDPDYVAGFSPFVMRDVNSKSAVLGLHRKGEFKYWMRRNPNEVVKHRKKK